LPDDFALVRGQLLKGPFSPDEAREVLTVGKVMPIMLMEYVSGSVLMGLSHEEYLSSDVCCQEIGELLAFDLLINNYDRLPLVWNNTGNSGNIIFCKPES